MCDELKRQLYDMTMKKYHIALNNKNDKDSYKYMFKIYSDINNMNSIKEISNYLTLLRNNYSSLKDYEQVVVYSILILYNDLRKKYNNILNTKSDEKDLSQMISMSFNPLKNENDLFKLCDLYKGFSRIRLSPNIDPYNAFYGRLIKENSVYSGKYSSKHRDEFTSLLFNKWKNNIVNMSKDDYLKLNAKGSVQEDFIKLREYLKGISDVKSKEEIDKILLNRSLPNEIKHAFKKYYYQEYNSYYENYEHSWNHIISTHLDTDKKEYIRTANNIEHRLYINIDSIAMHEFLKLLVEKYEKNKMPFYFKYNEFTNRSDKIVFYSSTKDIMKHVKIINEVIAQNPHLKNYMGKVNLFSGNVNEYIGYGSEPEAINGEAVSFNEKRTHASVDAISKSLREHISKIYNKTNHNKMSTSFNDIIRIIAKSVYTNGNYLNSNISEDELFHYIKNDRNVINMLSSIYTTDFNDINKCANINIKGQNVVIGQRYLETVVSDDVLEYLVSNDKEFVSLLKENMKNEYEKHNINTDRICFDNDKLKMLEDKEKNVDNSKNYYEKVIDNNNTTMNIVNYMNNLFKNNPSLLNEKKYKMYRVYYNSNGEVKNLNDLLTTPAIAITSFGVSLIKQKIYAGETPNNDLFYCGDNEINNYFDNILDLMKKIQLPLNEQEIEICKNNNYNIDVDVKIKSKLVKWYDNMNIRKNINYSELFNNMRYLFMMDVMNLEKSGAIRQGTYYKLYEEFNKMSCKNSSDALGGR